MVTYSDIFRRGNTIYNMEGVGGSTPDNLVGYRNPEELARSLNVRPDQIDWSKIRTLEESNAPQAIDERGNIEYLNAPQNTQAPRTLTALTGVGESSAIDYAPRKNPYEIFNTALQDMLTDYQQMGTLGIQQRQLDLSSEQAGRTMSESQGGFSPGQQSAMRNASAGALNPSIAGAQDRQQTFQEQLGAFGNMMKSTREYAQSQMEAKVKHEEDTRAMIQDAINTYGSSAFSGVDEKQLSEIESNANYPKGYLTRKSKTIKEQELAISQQNANTAAQKTTDTALDKNIGNTVKVGDKTYMWNPATQSYDDEVAPGSTPNMSPEKLASTQKALSAVQTLKSHPGLKGATGMSALIPIIPGTNEADFVSYLDSLKSLLTLENLGLMKGVLSDTDIKILQSAGTALNRQMTETTFNAELKKIEDTLNESLNKANTNMSGGGTSDIWDFKSLGSDSNNARKISQAIGQYESGGNYKAIGKVTASGDRAYGKYQVMGNNIPSWTKEALGKSMTPQEFLNSPEAQDKVAQTRMDKLYDQYGNIGDVASIWFSGRPMNKAGNARDVNNTTVPQYIKNVTSIYNRLS